MTSTEIHSTIGMSYYNQQPSWIIPVTVIASSIVATLWITVSFLHFGIKTGKWRECHFRNPVINLNGGLIYAIVMLCGVMAMCHATAGLIYISIGYADASQNAICDVMSDIIFCLYTLVLLSSVLYFWARQRIFFKNRMLAANYNKCVKTLSFLSLFIVVFSAVGVLAFIIHPNDHQSSRHGCVYNPQTKLQLHYLVSVIVVVILSHSVLWGLLLYALMKAKIKKSATGRSLMNTFSQKSVEPEESLQITETPNVPSDLGLSQHVASRSRARHSHRTSSDISRKTIKKTLILALVATLMDIFLQILIHYITKPKEHRRYAVMAAAINSFAHCFLIVLSFANFKQILTSLCNR